MKIHWKLNKKRGNLRPTLTYTVTLEKHEQELALPPVCIVSTIPIPEEPSQEHCYPGQFERSDKEKIREKDLLFHTLESPSHRGHPWAHTLRLPWREDNHYPEVEASFADLRKRMEQELAAAYTSAPLKAEHTLEATAKAQATVAPTVLAERFLQFSRNSLPQQNRHAE